MHLSVNSSHLIYIRQVKNVIITNAPALPDAEMRRAFLLP